MTTVSISLSQGKSALIDSDDADSVLALKWRAVKRKHTWYAIASVKVAVNRWTNVYLHRLVMGQPDGQRIDHRNGDGLDCRRENLRIATSIQNGQNKRIHSNNTSGYKGVSWDSRWRKWCAFIRYGGRNYNLGGYETPQLAAQAYDRAAKYRFGQFASVNFPEGV